MLQSQQSLFRSCPGIIAKYIGKATKAREICSSNVDIQGLFTEQTLPQETKRVVVQGIASTLFLPVIRAAWHNGWTVAVIRNDISDDHLYNLLAQLSPSLYISSADLALSYHDRPDFFSETNIENTSFTVSKPYVWREDQCAAVLFTSGSTGAPRGICHSYGNMLRSAQLFTRHFDLQSHDHLYCLAPPHSMSGFRSLLLPLVTKARVTMHPVAGESFLSIIKQLAQHKPTRVLCGPVFVHQLAAYGKRLLEYLHGIDSLLCTGAALNRKDQQTVQDIFRIPVLNYYGLTETAGIVLGEKTGRRAQTNLPPPCAGVEVELQSVEDSSTTFQLHVKSDNLFLGYLGENLQRRTSFYTGDLVRPSGNGALTLIGRATEAVKSPSTEWIFPSLLENWLKERMHCTDVVVHGVPIPGGHGLEVWLDTNELFNSNEIEGAISTTIGPDYRPIAWHQAKIVRNALGKLEHFTPKHLRTAL